MPTDRLSDVFHYERDPLNPLDRVLALQDPYSFEYKKLMEFYQADMDQHELCVQLMYSLLIANKQEEKRLEALQEAKYLKAEEKEKRNAVAGYNAEVHEEHQRAAANAKADRQQNRREEMKDLYERKAQVDKQLVVVDEKINKLETSWKEELTKSAEKFINDNFTKNENGRLVSKKNPDIELLDGADKVIKQIYEDAKSPADLVKYNPNLKDNPERMMVVDDVRKEVRMAKKVDKIVAQDVRDEANKSRKIIVRRPVRDENGELVYETDASGKKKVKTERVELTPETTKLKDEQATDESTKKKKKQLVCLGDVCFLRDEVIQSPVTHTAEQTNLATNLLAAGEERQQLQQEADALNNEINTGLKAAPELKADEPLDQVLVDVNVAAKEQKKAPPLKADDTPAQIRVEKNAVANEQKADIPEPPPPPPPYRRGK